VEFESSEKEKACMKQFIFKFYYIIFILLKSKKL